MSEQATADPPAEVSGKPESPADAATEVPTATTVVEEGGPMSFKEAADNFFKEQDRAEERGEERVEASLEDVESLLNPPKKKEEDGQETPREKAKPAAENQIEDPGSSPTKSGSEEEPEIEVPEFGFDGERETKEEAKEEFDADAFDKETDKQVEGLDPKAQDGWKKLRAQLKEAKQAAQQGTAEAEKIAALEKQAAEVEELRAKVDELTASDYVLKVQSSPEYRDKVKAPVAEINRVVEQVANAFEDIGQEKIMAAIREPDIVQRGRLLEALARDEDGESRMPSIVLSELQRASGIYHKVQADHERMLSDAETEWKVVQKQREKDALRAAEEDRSLLRRHLEDNFDKAKSLFDENALKEASRRASSIDIRNETPANRAYAQMAGEAFPLALQEIAKLRRQLSKAGVETAENRAATPNLSEGAKTEEKVDDRRPKTFAEAMARMPDNLSL